MLRVARSAKARATMMSASSIGARVTLSRFRAPRVTSRNRSGSADADRNPALQGGGGERRPAARPGLQVLVPDRLAGAEGIQARAFLRLQLEQLQQAHRLAGGGHQP